jgi:aminotransferase
MDQSRFIAKHVVNLPKSGIRDFFDIVAKMKDAISLGVGFSKPIAASRHLH